ncbi:MAG TPA: hypothetical protein VGE67_03195 [Haloferula sp.]
MRAISSTALFLSGIAIVACSKPAVPAASPKPAKYAALVTLVDSVPIPIPDSMIGEDFEGAVQDEPSLKFPSPPAEFPGGLHSSLLGPQDKPVALLLYSLDDIQTYYVPFKGVTGIDRPRRLTKLSDRVYQVESNRTTKGVLVEKQLP